MLTSVLKFYTQPRTDIEAKQVVGVFSNTDKSSEVLVENESLIRAQYKYLIKQCVRNDTRILVNGYNKLFLEVYDELDEPAELIILTSEEQLDSKEEMFFINQIQNYHGNNVIVITALLDADTRAKLDSNYLGVSRRVYDEAIMQYYAIKLCSSFVLMLDCDADSEYGILTVAAEAFSANKSVVKYSYVDGAVNAEQIQPDSIEISSSIFKEHGITINTKIAECKVNKYGLINLLHGDNIGTYSSFTPYVDTLSEVTFQKKFVLSQATSKKNDSEIRAFA